MKTTVVREFLNKNGITITDFAKQIGCKPDTFRSYLTLPNIPAKWVAPVEAAFTRYAGGGYYKDQTPVGSVSYSKTVNDLADQVDAFQMVQEIYYSKDISAQTKRAIVPFFIR